MALTDRRLFTLGRQYATHQAAAKKANADKQKVGNKIMDELERRGTKEVRSDDGLKINRIQAEGTMIDDDAIMDALTPKQCKAVTRRILDRALLSQEIQAGRIDASILQDNSTVTYNAPYINVTLGGD